MAGSLRQVALPKKRLRASWGYERLPSLWLINL